MIACVACLESPVLRQPKYTSDDGVEQGISYVPYVRSKGIQFAQASVEPFVAHKEKVAHE